MSFVAKELREKRFKLITDAQNMLSAPDAGDEAVETFDLMMDEADKLMTRIEKVEAAATKAAACDEIIGAHAETKKVSVAQVEDGVKRFEDGIVAKLRAHAVGGYENMSTKDRSALEQFQNAQTLTGTAGGYTVPVDLYRQIMEAMFLMGGVRSVAKIIKTDGGNNLDVVQNTDSASATLIAEGVAISAGSDFAFTKVTLGAYKYTSGKILITNELIADSAFSFVDWVQEQIVDRFTKGLNNAYTNGTGSSQPQGVKTAAIASGTVVTGATGQTTSILANDLLDLEHGIQFPYRRNATFMMSDGVFKSVKKLQDSSGRWLWMPSMAVNAPDSLIGYPVVLNADMSAPGANNYSMIFADFSQFAIRDVMNMKIQVLHELYAETDSTGVLAFARTDSRLLNPGTCMAIYRHSAT